MNKGGEISKQQQTVLDILTTQGDMPQNKLFMEYCALTQREPTVSQRVSFSSFLTKLKAKQLIHAQVKDDKNFIKLGDK